jgi:hypothetical protein
VINKPKTVEDHLLLLLQKGSLGTADLLAKMQENRPGTTKQALYQTLRKLKNDETVILRSKKVSLSHVWINKMANYFATVQRHYGFNDQPGEDFLMLTDGEKVSYTFATPAHTDMFWGHAFGILTDNTKEGGAICIYNPHEWFMVARHETERVLFDEIKNEGKKLYLLCGNKDPLDAHIANEFDGEFLHYYMHAVPLFPKNNYYLNIFDDFIIEAWLDPNVGNQIDSFYKQTMSFNDSVREKLQTIVNTKGKNKITISRNSKKANKLRGIFKKYFIIKNKV